jgi:hypothetical protein
MEIKIANHILTDLAQEALEMREEGRDTGRPRSICKRTTNQRIR